MKKQLLFIILIFLFFSNFLSAQKWEFGVTIKSNYSLIGIEDEIFEDGGSGVTGSTGVTITTSQDKDILRSTKGKMGLEMGLRVKYNIMERFSIISGIEGRYMGFNIRQRLEGEEEDLFTTLGTNEIPGSVYGVANGGEIVRGGTGENNEYTNYIESNTTSGGYQLFYLNIPLNLGYTTKSEKWTFFGGLWYSYLLQADFDYDPRLPISPTRYFERNIFGINMGIDFKINSNLYISLNYAGLASNLFASYKPIYHEVPATIFDATTNTIVENPHPEAGTSYWKNSEEKIPASQNFNLLSLGITYQIKSK